MPVFTEAEMAYLEAQWLGRLATAGRDGEPHVVPVGFRLNRELGAIEIAGYNFAKTKKFRDVQGDPRVAFVVDDSPAPGDARAVTVRGVAEILESGGEQVLGDVPGLSPEMLRIWPERIISWGLEADGTRSARSVSVPAAVRTR